MAKEKKKENLLLEEKLEQALVPVEEQPYKVPENWCWTYLENICEYMRAGGDKPKELSETKTKEFCIPVIANGIQNDGIIGYTNIENEKEGTVTVSGRGTIGYAVFREYPYYPIVRLIVLSPIQKCVSGKYIKFIFDYLEEKGTGSSIPQLTVPAIKKKPVPLPPVKEQQRIVEQIESLFIKLDEAKEKISKIEEEYLVRRIAILCNAFNGKLTESWRRKRGYSENIWIRKRFDEVAEIKCNLVNPNEYEYCPHIAPDNIEKRTGKLLDYKTIKEDRVTSGKHKFYSGQILYSKIRPYLSKVVIADFDGLCSADMYPIEAKENTKYLWYYMLSDDFLQQASSAGSRSVLPKINQKELSAIYVNMTSREEQDEIVKILDKLMPVEEVMMDKIRQVNEQIALMKKSILAKAFRGELGTNNTEEESAIELLKQIL